MSGTGTSPGAAASRGRAAVARRLPRPVKEWLRRRLVGPRWGELRRTRPFSDEFGYDRGRPIDRVYIERFLERHATDIRGDVLEVKNSYYTDLFGAERVHGRHVVDIDSSNRDATIVADIAERGSLPAERFDCFVLTQTLQLVGDPAAAVANAYAALAPGGALLVTVPTVTKALPAAGDRWRWTPLGLRDLLERECAGADVETSGHGNVLAAVAFLLGLAAHEVTEAELDVWDPDFAIVACARVRKPG